jgi:hypothetical protein
MDAYKIRENLLNELYKLPVHNLSANKKEISIRCPYCGDSVKHASSSHLYINVDPSSDRFLTFYCFKCKTKGYTNAKFLKLLKLNNSEMILELEKFNLKNKNKKNFNKKSLRKNKLIIPIAQDNKNNQIKLKYINSRLGTHLSYEDLVRYKIVLSLYDVLEANKISYLNCKEKFADTLDGNFLGFVSYDNNYIIFRNLSKKIMPDLRYHNYNIHGLYDNTKKFYIIPNRIDVLNPNIHVVMTEGVFDLLSVFFNIKNCYTENTLYIAVNGIGYNNVFSELIRKGFLNIDLEVYGDNDQNINIYRKLKEEFYPFIDSFFLYTNTKYKDFGDITKGISIKKMRI